MTSTSHPTDAPVTIGAYDGWLAEELAGFADALATLPALLQGEDPGFVATIRQIAGAVARKSG